MEGTSRRQGGLEEAGPAAGVPMWAGPSALSETPFPVDPQYLPLPQFPGGGTYPKRAAVRTDCQHVPRLPCLCCYTPRSNAPYRSTQGS